MRVMIKPDMGIRRVASFFALGELVRIGVALEGERIGGTVADIEEDVGRHAVVVLPLGALPDVIVAVGADDEPDVTRMNGAGGGVNWGSRKKTMLL